ncbi:DUF1192 domain-containing protein [Agrobacterium rosae]|uniref:Putative small protein containing a coiled-coil domain protein n=1 Tax=Agrobacterium rosae TaxID=1972867 RepID=A0A1R3TZP6_9HYPH|nr:DUF1192 domain-containing protein [Agrobacterium rosae]SCX25509.1 putative small protein containing a coiled-coil domain protein [Agrobacterium rosae]
MSGFDEELPTRPATTHVVGGDISLLSVDELTARIAVLHAEIERLETELEKKSVGRKAAESLFRS